MKPNFLRAQVLPGQALPPGIREQLNGPIILPSMYLRRATKAFQVSLRSFVAAGRCCCSNWCGWEREGFSRGCQFCSRTCQVVEAIFFLSTTSEDRNFESLSM